ETLRDQSAPLVLAGVEYLWPLYRAANTYPHLVEGGVAGNPQGSRPDELHAKAWKLVEPHFTRPEREARARFEELAGRQGAGRTSIRALDRIADVVPAAGAGRIDSLFIALDAQAWGRVDDANLATVMHSSPQPGDEDLLNRAALETYLKGGAVFAVPSERVPGRTPAAAILRFCFEARVGLAYVRPWTRSRPGLPARALARCSAPSCASPLGPAAAVQNRS